MDKANIASQNFIRFDDVCNGSPSRILIVLLISLGITTLPRSSILLTIPVAFIYNIPFNAIITEAFRFFSNIICRKHGFILLFSGKRSFYCSVGHKDHCSRRRQGKPADVKMPYHIGKLRAEKIFFGTAPFFAFRNRIVYERSFREKVV